MRGADHVSGFIFVFAMSASCAAQLPETCKPPSELASALHAKPSATVYDAAGAWFANHGSLKCALAAFGEAVHVEPQSAEAHYDLGVARIRAKQLNAAADEFRLVLQYRPDMAAARNSLAAVLLDMNRPAEAEAEFRTLLKSDGDKVATLDGLAQSLVAQSRYSAAMQYWNQALAIQPDSPDVSLSMAVATYQSGDAKGAIQILVSLTQAHPEMKAAHFTLANTYAHESRFNEAAAEYGEVLRLDPADDPALLARVKALATIAAYQDALPQARTYIQRKPGDPEGHLVLGSIDKGLGEYSEAEKELAQVVAVEPGNGEAQYEFGFVLARNQKAKQALPHLQKAVALNPSDTSAQFQLAAVLRTLGDTQRAADVSQEFKKNKENEFKLSQMNARGNEANQYLHSGQPERAAEAYRQILKLDPNNAHTEYNLALALDAAKDLKGEKEALEKAIQLDPKMAIALAQLGVMDIAEGNLPSAQKRLETAIAIDPQLAPAQGNLGLLYALRGENVKAEQLFRAAIENDPKYMQGYLNLGLTLASEQRFAEAAVPLQRAVQLAPDEVRVLSALGKVKARMGESAEAVTLLRKVVALQPDSVDAHLSLGIALADAYDLQGALMEADTALRLAPQSAAAHLNRGRILFDLGRRAEAKNSLEEADRLAPAMPEPHYFLAVIEKEDGHYDIAAGLLQTVVKYQPNNVMAWYSLGQCLKQLSKEQEAMAAWRRAIAIDPDYTPALFNLSRALSASDPAESERLNDRFAAVLKKKRVLDQSETRANAAMASIQAHEWFDAEAGLTDAIKICGGCSSSADLHKKLGLVYCQAGDVENGEKELRFAQASEPDDPDIRRALALIAQVRAQHATP